MPKRPAEDPEPSSSSVLLIPSDSPDTAITNATSKTKRSEIRLFKNVPNGAVAQEQTTHAALLNALLLARNKIPPGVLGHTRLRQLNPEKNDGKSPFYLSVHCANGLLDISLANWLHQTGAEMEDLKKVTGFSKLPEGHINRGDWVRLQYQLVLSSNH